MRTAILTTLLSLVLIVTTAAKPNLTDSIRPLQIKDKDSGEFWGGCTAWAARQGETRVWISALHCVLNTSGEVLELDWYIDGQRVTIFNTDPSADLISFKGGPSATPLVVSFQAPEIAKPVRTLGYPHGSLKQYATVGIVSSPFAGTDGRIVYSLPGAPGMSGAPIFTSDDLVVGMMQATECMGMSWCPITRGVPLDVLRTFLSQSEPPVSLPRGLFPQDK